MPRRAWPHSSKSVDRASPATDPDVATLRGRLRGLPLHSAAVGSRILAVTLLGALCASGALAESEVILPLPSVFGNIPAETWDAESGERVGEATMSVVRRPDGLIEMVGASGIDGSANTLARAVLEVVPGGDGLRLLRQSSESHDAKGRSLGVLSIDHQEGRATCGVPPGSGDSPAVVELPAQDRVVNVPLNLLFHELVTGKTEQVSFQVLLCRFGARLIPARAKVIAPLQKDGSGLLEVEYNVDFGMLNSLAAPFLPKLSFWFDPDSPGSWIAHRMPLFSKGPTVLVVRSGFTPTQLQAPEARPGY